MDRGTMNTELTLMARKAGPAVLGSAGSAALGAADRVTVLGLSTEGWAILVSIVTLCYVAMQGFFLLRDKWWRDPQRKVRRRKSK